MSSASRASATAVGVETCYICRVRLDSVDPQPVTTRSQLTGTMHIRHWLIPESFHDKVVKSQLMTRKECEDNFIPACYMCHQAAINYFTDAERYWHLNSEDKLRNALDAVGWRKIRGEQRNFTPAKLKNFQWVTQRVEDVKNKLCTFKDSSRWSDDIKRDALPSFGEMLDMFEKHTKDAEEREQALETRLSAKYAADLDQVREKFAAEIEGVKETIKIADDKLESLKARFGEMEERFNDRRDGEKIGETAPDNEKLARANRELIGILRRDLDEFREEWETLRGTQQRADRARDEKIQNVSDEIEVVKSNQSNTKRLQKKLQNLEWRVMENVAVPTEVNDKGKGKRKRKEKEKNKETEQETVTNARMPATANEAMADVDGVLATKNRRIVTQISYPDSEYSTDEDSNLGEAIQAQAQSKSRPPPFKRQRMNDNVEVEIPSRPYAKKTGRPVSASKQLPTRPAVQVESAKSVTVPNGTTERSAGKEAAVAANVSASVIRETPSRHTADEPSVLAEAASATHVTDAQQQKAANTPSRVATKNPNDKLLPTNDAAEAVKRAVEDVVLRARTTTLPTRAIETTMAVDLPPSHQAAAASSSGSFRPVRQFATLTSAVDKGSKQGSTVPNTSAAITQPRPTLYITQPRPTLYPPSRMEASAKAAAGASAKHNGTSIGDKPSIPAPADVQTKAAEPATSRLPAVFPPLSREDSVESSLPDLSDLFKHTTTRHARALAQDSDNSEVLFVKSSLGFGHGAKRRGKHGKTTTVKEESKDA